jgi:hypothetical protein
MSETVDKDGLTGCSMATAGDFGRHFECARPKRAASLGVGQRHAINFVSDEGRPALHVIQRLREYYGKEALSQTQLSYWIRQLSARSSNSLR